MKTGTLLKKWVAVLCAALLTISLFAIPAFATTPEEDADAFKLSTGAIVGIIIGVVVLAVAVVLCIKFREKIKKFLRVYKSEVKKIVWLPWDQTRKSTWVVLVVLFICAAVICLLDFGLGHGILAFINLF
ncbi:MAG: preprotein translocase subunit SecE [Clostridia bacterium]|nr:preprotein translocase subunit SecE [Clostridia bacterium]